MPAFKLAARSTEERGRTPSLVDVTLDETQRAAIELPPERALLVLGEAGHGKTTVLLHRVLRMWRAAGRSMRAAVLVPNEGLVRLLQLLLRRLGVDVEVWTFDRFAAKQARRAFRRLPRESDLTPPSVMRMKRCPALRSALEELADRAAGVIDDDADAASASSRSRRKSRALVSRGDLQHLFGDRLLMEHIARTASLPAYVVDDVLERTRVQFTATTEREWSHVTDRERLVALDHRALDEGTSSGHATTVDVEDYAILFELDRLRAARRGVTPTTPRRFDLIAVDEAQELAPLELALIGRSLAPSGTLVVSGDADQQTDETSAFLGWEAAMRELGAEDHASTKLEIGYRCAPDVVALARAIRAGVPVPPALRQVHAYDDERALAADIGASMATVLQHDKAASIAVLCRHPLTARRFGDLLRKEVPTRVVFDGRFLPRGPVQVSLVEEVKGLEFDYVVVPDAGAREWRDEAAARRAMYVAVTRARHQAALACVGEPTPIVRPTAAKDG
jgi:DNA helicase IV